MTQSQLLFHQIYIPSIVINLINNKNHLVRLTSFQKPTISLLFNLLQVWPSKSTSIFAVLFILSFNALNYYFYVSLNVAAVSTVRIFINFVTVPKKVFFFRRNFKPTAETNNAFKRPHTMWSRHGLQHSSSLLFRSCIKVQKVAVDVGLHSQHHLLPLCMLVVTSLSDVNQKEVLCISLT